MDLPALTDAEVELLESMHALLSSRIDAAGGALPFDHYMETALYAPGLGYYSNGRRKFGEGGDFVTAPEISPLFSRCLARQVAECLDRIGGGAVLEVGAGSGRMAAELLVELDALDALPSRYLILDLSPSLKQLQREQITARVPHLLSRVDWLPGLPAPGFQGVLLGNELLDAMPVHRFRRHADAWQELSVTGEGGRPSDHWRAPHSPGLEDALAAIWPDPDGVADGYSSEINLRLAPWLHGVAGMMQRGYLLLVDYGYTQREYYHPERSAGTLVCHYRHRAHADPYWLPGLQDMTASVDFTAVARAAVQAGFTVCGYTTQAHFLIDNGLDQLLAASGDDSVGDRLALIQGVKRLTLPAEMGERFKVIALARDAHDGLSGFRSRDLRDRL